MPLPLLSLSMAGASHASMATLLATRRRLITSVLTTTQVKSIGPAQHSKWTSGRSFLTSSKSPTIPNFAFAFEYVSLLACQIPC